MSSQKTKFKDFIKYYDKEYYSSKLMNNSSRGTWNPKRRDYLKQYNNNRKSFLLELEEIEATSVSDLVPKEFFSASKSKNIFSNFLKDLSQEICNNKNGLLTIDSCSIIAEQKEEYETIKRNLNKYIDYIMNKNIFLMKYYSKNVNLFYLKIEDSLVKISLMKKKMNFIKKHYFMTNAKIHLKKQKIINCKKIYQNLKKLQEFKKMYLSINNKNNNNSIIKGKIADNKSKFNRTEELIKNIERFKYYNNSLICFWFIQNLKLNKNDYIDNYEEFLSKLFLTKLSLDEFSSLFDIFYSVYKNKNNNNINNKNVKSINNELLNKLIIFFKKDIFNMLKGILLSYATIDYTESMNSNLIRKLRQLQELSFEERKLFLAINQICITLLSFCDNLYNYMSIKEYRNTKLGQILYNNRKVFYDIMNKKLRKILFLFSELILNFSNESNIYLILSSISLTYAYIENTFQINENKSPLQETNSQKKKIIINNNNKNTLIKSITFNNSKILKKNEINQNLNNNLNQTTYNISCNQDNLLKTELNSFYNKLIFSSLKQKIKNLSIYLNKDNWKKINILNLNEQINKRNIRILKYKDYLSLPYSNHSKDKNEIKKRLTNLLNFKEGKNIKINLNHLFNKKINERNILFSSSSFHLFNYILDIYCFYLIIPSLKLDIFKAIFNIYEYFIYSTMYMFHRDKINFENIKKKLIIHKNSITYDELAAKSKEIDNILNNSNIISFMIECKKEVLVKIVGNEKALFTILPMVNSSIINYNRDGNNNINIDNFLEKIICYECLWTSFKIIKRMIPANKNNNINNNNYLTQINKYKILLNEIRNFLYSPISIKFIKDSSYINSFINTNWQSPQNTNKMKNKININSYIQIMLENVKDLNDKLNMFLPISIKAKIRFIHVFIFLMFNNLKENIDKIKNINIATINIIFQDLKLYKNKLYEILICNDNGNELNSKLKNKLFDTVFNDIFDYLNTILMSKDTFMNSVGKNKIPLHLINCLLNMNKTITSDDKMKIKIDLKCNYMKEIQIINNILLKDN